VKRVEEAVLAELAWIKRELMEIKQASVCEAYEQANQKYAAQLQALSAVHKRRKMARNRQRSCFYAQVEGDALEKELERLKQESRRDSAERRDFKQARSRVLVPLAQSVAEVEERVRSLKQKYAQLSREWQMQMKEVYFAELASKPIKPLIVLYEDAELMVVDKPAGLLSVPGRQLHLQDSVVSRLQYQRFGQGQRKTFLQAVHRLDRDTSGVMAIALSATVHAALSKQFAQRRVRKVYEAVLARRVGRERGSIELPLWSCPESRPKQVVNVQRGKPSRTAFEMLAQGERTRVQLVPLTGRTHQLRVHAAHPNGLDSPILGDSLYGNNESAERLFLHANLLEFVHPVSKQPMRLESIVPF